MKTTLSVVAITIAACIRLSAADGEAKSEVLAAAKKLKANYSWTSTPKWEGAPGNFRPGPTEGQADAGMVYLKMSFGDRNPEAVIKGEKVAVKGEDAWENGDELEGNRAFMARRLKTMKAPAEEAQDLAENAKSLKKDGDTVSGDLTEAKVAELITFRRPGGDNNRPAPKDAKGTVKFWIKDGALAKYEYHVEGKITGRDDQEFNVNRTTTVDIKSVGSTKLAVPEEAKKKLG